MASPLTGQSIDLVEGPRLLSGGGRFIDDASAPDMGHAVFVRSPHAHARIVGIDTAVAAAAAGVRGVFSAADLAERIAPMSVTGPPGHRSASFTALAGDKVRLVGDPVAVVVADTRAAAVDAANLVVVDYEPLAPVVRAADVLAGETVPLFDELGDNVVFRDTATWGDIDAAFADADRVVARRYVQHRYGHAPLEGRGGLATYDPRRGELDYLAANKRPHVLRLQLAALLGLAHRDIRVHCGDIGGAFGSKGQVGREDIVVCAVAVALGRPVKWVEDRTENLLAAGQAREDTIELAAAVRSDGEILGLRASLVVDQGAYPAVPYPSSLFTTLVKMLLPNCYRIGAYAFDGTIVSTNKGSYIPYRGPWTVETWARERLIDEIAADLDLEPHELRLRNLIPFSHEPSVLTTGPSAVGITADQTLERAVELLDLHELRVDQLDGRRDGRLIGIGLATFIEMAPGPADFAPLVGFDIAGETAWARLEPTGDLTVTTWQVPHGQNHETTIAQVAADALGVGLDRVHIVWGDTAHTPFTTLGTGGSRAAAMASGAAIGATRLVREQVLAIAAQLLEASAADLEIDDGVVAVRGTPSRSVSLADVARVAYFAPSQLPAGARPTIEASYDHPIPEGGWVQATHACIVEVDTETGAVEILRYLVVEDCGDLINPAVVDGQIRGGVTQGIAGVLYEHLHYDDDGQPRATNFAEYLVPSATEIPTIEIEHWTGARLGDHDYRGVGEGGAIGAPAALTNAIADALRHLGVSIDEQYLPPARLCELIRAAETD